jgi:Flp pilus assembly secretin CpaC
MIQVEQMPSSTSEKIQQAINSLGGADVTVERIMRGDVDNDATDTLLLKGQVQNQVALVRVLNVAARLFLGQGEAINSLDAVEAIADESGALISERDNNSSGGNSSGGGQAGQQLGGGRSGQMDNEIKANIGRAKLLSVANGRILSMIEVRDLPQVRVSVQIHEVNRIRMKNWRPDLTMVSDGFKSESQTPGGSGLSIQPDGTQRIGPSGGSQQVENALQILGGTFTNQLQIGGAEMAFDLLFSLMESEGISRTLARPTLTVLAGESALFQVGGEVPVPSSFAAPGNDTNGAGVFSGTNFRSFGVQLEVRPMVGEDDRITLDVRPSVSMPDNLLTQQIAGSTGNNLNTTAFNTRSLETTTRLRDGQPLVIGGLVSRGIGEQKDYTPGLHKIPAVGWLAKSSDRSDSDRELIIIVTPTIIREPLQNIALWQFPSAHELLEASVTIPSSDNDGEGE